MWWFYCCFQYCMWSTLFIMSAFHLLVKGRFSNNILRQVYLYIVCVVVPANSSSCFIRDLTCYRGNQNLLLLFMRLSWSKFINRVLWVCLCTSTCLIETSSLPVTLYMWQHFLTYVYLEVEMLVSHRWWVCCVKQDDTQGCTG